MNMSQISGLLRTILTIAGTYLASQGYITAGDAESIVGAVMVLTSIGATTWVNRSSGIVKAASKLEEVKTIAVEKTGPMAKVVAAVDKVKFSATK